MALHAPELSAGRHLGDPRARYGDAVDVDRDEIPVAHPDEHTMAGALDTYVAQRLPATLLDDALASGTPIEIHGIYPDHLSFVMRHATRSRRAVVLRPSKVFNRIRPEYFAAPRPTGDALVVAVPPGRDYVLHYASLVSHYVGSRGAPDGLRRVARYPIAEESIAEWTGLAEFVQQGDRVLIGYVQELVPLLLRGGATVLDEHDNAFYGATRLQFPGSSEVVCALGVRFSFWGCISARLAATMHRLGAREVVYAGKLGCLASPDDIYRRLFTPSKYLHLGPFVRLVKPPGAPPNGLLARYPELDTGVHMSVGTVLEEDVKQRAYADTFHVNSIDNEISQIAQALASSVDGRPRTGFSALHFATDYLRSTHESVRSDLYNLSNHRERGALRHKGEMLRQVAARLQDYFDRPFWAPSTSGIAASIAVADGAAPVSRLSRGHV